MKLNLERLFNVPDERCEFSGEIDLTCVKRHGEVLLPKPVSVRGVVENRAGIVTLRYHLSGEMPLRCDRCLKDFVRTLDVDFEHPLIKELSGEDDGNEYLVLPDAVLTMDGVVSDDLLLSLDQVIICKEDCKGLCPVCGADRNEVSCGCADKVVDSRLEDLKKLLD